MKKHYFCRKDCPHAPAGYNRGELVEWRIGYELTGKPNERNNKPADVGGDVGEWQVKSPKATLTGKDNCGGFIFGFADADFFYEMSIAEFAEFAEKFTYTDYDSRTHKAKTRVKGDSKKMREWLEARA